MSFASMHDDPETLPRPDARARIHDARISEFAFLIRRIASPLPDDDIILLATLLSEAVDNHKPVSKDTLEAQLRAQGRSPLRSSQLAAALFK